ncbi:TAXI family TRAP transporter solute-binding subunit [Rhodospirillum rubrum]|nr:TAXI family TRAP transporter solute-binding subunit [Rhodospirillum rubrum]AEO46609.1 TRAP transporter solute receptor TAXI family protein [Rhodospirillum rubrum F11]QXG80640.1 TAXI family TRAP transporter solute-binding subunit [Rhodospirillum rubrum]
MNKPMTRRGLFALVPQVLGMAVGMAGMVAPAVVRPSKAQELRFLRIGTGRTSGAYFPVGGLIASLISNPPGSRPCEKGGSCGVPGLIAVAQSTGGSVDNIVGLQSGQLDLAICQADVAYDAYSRTDAKGVPDFAELRAVASLYKESLHLVARVDSGISTLADLRGKRVGLGDPASGTLVSVRLLLSALGLGEKAVKADYDPPSAAADKVADGRLDAFFFFGGEPVALITSLRERAEVTVVPVDGPAVEDLAARSPFLTLGLIRQQAYDNPLPIVTLQVAAVLVTRADMDDALIEAITAALWHRQTKILFEKGPPQITQATLGQAVQGIAVPLHPGAMRYYRKEGIIDRPGPMQP